MDRIEKDLRNEIADNYYHYLGDVEYARIWNIGFIFGTTVWNKPEEIDDEMSDRLENYNNYLAKKMLKKRIRAFMEYKKQRGVIG